MPNSGTVTAGSAALASQYNNLRADVLNVSTGHTHTGASEDGAKVAATGISSGTAANGAVLTANGSGASAFLALASTGADVQTFTSSGSWVKPSGKTAVYVFAVGGGAGGNGGARAGAGTAALGGSGGNGAGDARAFFNASSLSGTVTVTIGAGGAGGTARTTNGTQVNGQNGGTTSFGDYLRAAGGFSAGTAADGYSTIAMPFGRTTMESVIDNTVNTRTVPGSGPRTDTFWQNNPTLSVLEGGIGGYSQTIYGRPSHDLQFGAAGGGAGGEKQSTNAANDGGAGGRGFGIRLDTAAAGGTANGGAATAAGTAGLGNGGAGGGAGSASTNAGAGSNGYLGGGGGGGGGAQTGNSGAGGSGGGGYVLVISV